MSSRRTARIACSRDERGDRPKDDRQTFLKTKTPRRDPDRHAERTASSLSSHTDATVP